MKKNYIIPTMSVAEMQITGNVMVTASEEWAQPELPDLVKGEFEGQEEGTSGTTNLWDQEW